MQLVPEMRIEVQTADSLDQETGSNSLLFVILPWAALSNTPHFLTEGIVRGRDSE